MIATLLLPIFVLLAGSAVVDDSIDLAPVPPIGSTITLSPEGVIRIAMTQSGTVILGTGSVISREGNRAEMPGRYHIKFSAKGKMVKSTAGSRVTLVVYLNRGPFSVSEAHGGKVLLSSTRNWSKMRTSFLAKSGGAGKTENVILAIHFAEPGTVELKELSCAAVDLPED